MNNGQKVYFGRVHGEKTLGEIVKINAKSVKVKQLESRGSFKDHPIGTMWKVHPSLVSPADGAEPTPASVEAPKPARPELDIMRDIRTTYGRLSPENLSCDGELPRSEVNRRRAHFNRQLKALFVELGRQVDESEAYDYMDKNAPPMGYMQGRGAS